MSYYVVNKSCRAFTTVAGQDVEIKDFTGPFESIPEAVDYISDVCGLYTSCEFDGKEWEIHFYYEK